MTYIALHSAICKTTIVSIFLYGTVFPLKFHVASTHTHVYCHALLCKLPRRQLFKILSTECRMYKAHVCKLRGGSDTGYYQQQWLCLAAFSLLYLLYLLYILYILYLLWRTSCTSCGVHLIPPVHLVHPPLSSLRRPRVNISSIVIVLFRVILSVIVTCTILKLFLCIFFRELEV